MTFNRRMATAIAALLLVALAVPASATAHKAPPKRKVTNATFGAGPSSKTGPDGRSYFTFETSPGGQAVDHIEVTNYSTKPEQLAVYPVDAVPATNGTISYPARSAPRRLAGAWIAVGTPHDSGEITVPPRHRDILPVHVQLPANAPPGDNLGAIVVSLTGFVTGGAKGGPALHLKLQQRLAIRVLFRVAGPIHPLVTIEHLKASYHGSINPLTKGKVTVTYDVHNGGNVIVGGPQTVSVSGLFGEHVGAHGLTSLPPLLPGATYPVSVVIPKVYPEVYMGGQVTINVGGLTGQIDPGLHPISSSVHFFAIPWILLVVLVLLILYFAWRYRRRRKRRTTNTPQPGGTQPIPQPQGAAQ